MGPIPAEARRQEGLKLERAGASPLGAVLHSDLSQPLLAKVMHGMHRYPKEP
jgi:hypothetical protein